MPRGTRTRIAPGIFEDQYGRSAIVKVQGKLQEKRYAPGTALVEMEAWRRAQVSAMPRVPRGQLTLAGAIDTYLKTVTSMPSFKGRRADAEAWAPRFGHRSIASLESIELAGQINDWIVAGVAASTLNHRRQALRAVLQAMAPDAVALIDATQSQKPLPLEARALPWADVRELLAAIRDNKSGVMLRVMALTGLPPARIRALRPEHVQKDTRTVFLTGRKKGQGTVSKTVRVTPEALAALADYFRLFPTGGAVAKNSWIIEWHKTVAAVNTARAKSQRDPLPRTTDDTPARLRLRPYDLRHSFGTEAYRRSSDLKAVAEALDVSLETAQRYTLGAVSQQVDKVVAAMTDPPQIALVRRDGQEAQ